MRWVGHLACMGKGRSVCRVLVGKPAGKRPLGRPRHRRADINMDLSIPYFSTVWKYMISLIVNLVLCFEGNLFIVAYIYIYIYIYIQGVPGGMCNTSGEFSLC
jgi:hypothetical protein